MIVDAARKGSIDHRNAIEALQQLNPAPESVIPYLVEQIQNNDYWTRHDALDAVGEFGRSAAPAMSAVRERLDDEGTEVRLAAAKALYQITGDTSRLEQELDAVLGGDELMYQSGAIKTITDLGPSGTPFMHYVTAALKEPHQTFVEELIEALQAVGSAEAVAALEQTAQSNDWILRSNATAVLRQLRDSGSKGDD
jgi:HEAT repeat protein